MKNPLLQLQGMGQSPWLDYIRRDLIESGALQRYAQDGVRGVTSNPDIFEKAIAGSTLYDADIAALPHHTPVQLYEALAIDDIQRACDVFSPLYRETGGTDGFVSLEVSPHLAHDAQGTMAEAKRLFKAVSRPNLMVKVPATGAGLVAIEALIAAGVSVNVTLIFSQRVYESVCQAYLQGLEQRRCTGQPVAHVASVASVFVSRIDTLIDAMLEEKARTSPAQAQLCQALMGKAGIANLKQIYQRYKTIFHGPPFAALHQAGAQAQRPLWASTSTKNPRYADVMYVEALVGPETVNTLPPSTLQAFRDHGKVQPTLEAGLDEAQQALVSLEHLGIDLEQVMEQLLLQGLQKFVEPFDRLLRSLQQKMEGAVG